jgi:hypothetical protein
LISLLGEGLRHHRALAVGLKVALCTEPVSAEN